MFKTPEENAKDYLNYIQHRKQDARYIELTRMFRTYENQIKRLEQEIYFLRLYGNKDCTAMADEQIEIARKEANTVKRERKNVR